jgi:heavy metal translocating P-type ATPase
MTLIAELTKPRETRFNRLRQRVANQVDKEVVTLQNKGAPSNGLPSNGAYNNGVQPTVDAFGKLASFWKKSQELYQKYLPEAVALNANLADLVNDSYARSKDAWDQGMVVLERVSEQQIKPILGDTQRDRQLREFAADTQAQPRTLMAQNVNRDFTIGTASLGLAMAGSLLYSPLYLLSIPGLLYSVRHMFQNSYQALRKEGKVHVNALSSITVVACLLSGYYVAAAMTGFFYTFSQKLLLQVKIDSKKSLVNVFRLSSQTAWVLIDGVEVQISIEKVQRGAIVIVNAGELIPVDGVITQGMASVDQQMLTGEAQPVEKSVGDTVFAMTLLLTGKIQVRVEQAGKTTTAAQIGQLLNRTTEFKTGMQLRSEQLAQKTVWPTLILSALSVPLVGPMGAVAVVTAHFGNRMNAIGGIGILNYFRILSRQGMLIKDGRTLELIHQVDTVVFDKTGTLTQEQPTLGVIHTYNGYDENRVLTLVAAAEYRQTHPIARAILHAAQQRNLVLPPIDDAAYQVGYGLTVQIEDQSVRVGSIRFIENEGIRIPAHVREAQAACYEQGYSLVFVAVNDQLIGALELLPSVRPEAKAVVEGLRQRGIKSIVIISGDHELPTRKLAQELGIDRYFAQTLPQNKAAIIEQLQGEGRTVCYVGDGINDTIALKKAQVSISLRGASTAATDTAQIILMDQSLQQLCPLFDLSREFSTTLDNSFNLILIPVALGIGGIYFAGWQVVHVLLLKQLFTLVSLGNVMWPLQKYRGLLADIGPQPLSPK